MSDDVVIYLSLEECIAVEMVAAVTQWSSLERIPQELYGATRTAMSSFSRDEINAVRKSFRLNPAQELMCAPMKCPIGEKK